MPNNLPQPAPRFVVWDDIACMNTTQIRLVAAGLRAAARKMLHQAEACAQLERRAQELLKLVKDRDEEAIRTRPHVTPP
jgi:hypothetical protein